MHTSTSSETVQSAVIVVIVVFIIARRLRGRRVNGWRQPIMITAMAAYGAGLIFQAENATHAKSFSHGDLTLLGAGALISLVLGALRGATVEFFQRGGELYSRYRLVTVLLWLVTLAIRLGIDAGSSHFNADHRVAMSSLVLMFALSLAGETITLKTRVGQGGRSAGAYR